MSVPFNEDKFYDLITATNNNINYFLHECPNISFCETFRTRTILNIHDYIYDTVEYGKSSGTKNRLLFGGELNYLTDTPYDIIAHTTLWRLFNIYDEYNINQIKKHNPQLSLEINKNCGVKFKFNIKVNNFYYKKEFETIYSPKTIKYVLDNLIKYDFYSLAHDLYMRFKLYGFIDYLNTLTDFDLDILEQDCITNNKVLEIDLSNFADPDCWHLNSIYEYSQYIRYTTKSSVKSKYIDDLLNYSEIELKQIAKERFQDTLVVAYNMNYPVLYCIRK